MPETEMRTSLCFIWTAGELAKSAIYDFLVVTATRCITCVEKKGVGLAGLEVQTCAIAVANDRVGFSRQIVGQVFVAVQSYHWRRLFYTQTTIEHLDVVVKST